MAVSPRPRASTMEKILIFFIKKLCKVYLNCAYSIVSFSANTAPFAVATTSGVPAGSILFVRNQFMYGRLSGFNSKALVFWLVCRLY